MHCNADTRNFNIIIINIIITVFCDFGNILKIIFPFNAMGDAKLHLKKI